MRLRRGAGSPVLLAVLAGVLLTTGTDAAAVADARAASAAVRPTSASAVEPALDPTALGTGAPAARLAARACPTPLATTPGVRVRCATLTVPLDRAHPALGTAKLLVTRVLPPGRPAAEPVIHLAGGPGGSAESYLPVLPTVFAELAARTGREVVILDQRGTGRSRPLLTCGDAPVDAACAAASARRGAPVTAFGVDANADDVADLVRALGARRAHVWGQSFGSGLAIVLAHRHPGVLASLTLEAVDRPASATAGPRAFVAALRAVDAACARQRACLHRTGGNLYHRAVSAAAALAARPLATAAGPVDGDRFVLAVETLLEVARGSSQAPDLVGAAARGDAVVTGQLVLLAEGQPLPGGTFGTLMNAAMNCSEAATTPGAVRRANAGVPAAFGVLVRRAVEQYATTCTRIGRRQDRDAQARPRAGAPVLVVNGVLDPNTGLQAAELVARDFPRATLLRVAGSGHFPVIRGNSCTLPVLARFVVRPDKHPSAPCASAPPSLSAPPPPLTATRTGPVRVEDAAGAFTARGPVSWWSTGSGLFLSADGAAVSVARTAGTAQAALSDLLAALQLPADSPRTATPGGWIAVQVADPARGLTVAAVRAAPDGVRLLAVTAPPNLAAPANTLVVEPLLSTP